MISLLTFIQTGRLGEIGLGSTRQQVELAFGPPDNWDTRLILSDLPVWDYGTIKVCFDAEIVALIYSKDFGVPHMGLIDFDPWKIRSGPAPDEVAHWLDAAGLPFTEGWGDDDEEWLIIDNEHWFFYLGNGLVSLGFGNDGKRRLLSSFWCR